MPDELLTGTAPAAAEPSGLTGGTPAPVAAPVEPSTPAAEAPAEAPKSLDETLRENVGKIWNKNNPPRTNGRFAPHAPGEPALEASPDQPPTVAPEPVPPAIEAPHSWSSEDKTLWAKAPPDVQAIVARREAEAHRQITRMGEQIRTHEPLRQVIDQHRDYLSQIGSTPEAAFAKTIEVNQALSRNPAAVIGWLANAYRVDLQKLAGGQQQQPSNAPARDVQLEARVRRMEAEHRARQEADRLHQERNVHSTIERFAADKGHPHFEDLQDEIRKLIPGIREDDPSLSPEAILSQAYEKAQWAHATTRQRLIQEQLKAEEEKKRAEAGKQAAEAKRQQALNQRSSKGVIPATGSLDDSIRRNLKRAMGS